MDQTVDASGQRSFPQVAIETGMLVEHLSKKAEGDIVTYKELETVVGRSVRPGNRGYGYLISARRILLRDHNMLIDSEPKVGVRICTDQEKMIVAGRDVKKAGRSVKRSGQKLRAVEYEKLSEEEKREWNARMSLTGALSLLSLPANVRKIEQAVTDHALPSAKVLELFRG